MGKRPIVAIIGAGSLSHGKRLVDELLGLAELEGGRLALMGNNFQRLDIVGRYARRAAAELRPSLEILVTTDRRLALEGADLVYALFDVGGFPSFDLDCRIAEAYGLDWCIGDTAGPLGAMRALRNGPVMLALADDMAAICPGALLVNYVNPMAPLVAAAASRGVDCLGLCGGVEATREYAAGVLGLEPSELEASFAGVNHLCWLLELAGPEGDLYPRFRELMSDPERRGEEAPRFEVLQRFGFFATESSGHISDFFPWFRRSPELRERYCYGRGYAGASGAYRKLAAFVHRRLGEGDFLEGQAPSTARGANAGSAIAEAVLGGATRKFYGNAINGFGGGAPAIPNLPPSACVELPLLLEGRRLTLPPIPALPSALAALCAPSVLQHGLVLESLLTEDPGLVFAAIAQDGLTAAVLDLPSIQNLTAELLAANASWLPAGLRRPFPPAVDACLRPGPGRERHRRSDPTLELVRDYERRRGRARSGYSRNPGS